MYLIEDSRQKSGAHAAKHKDWKDAGDIVLKNMLPFGDYCVCPPVFVDTKSGLQEIARNLCTKDRMRVAKEEQKAEKMNSKLVFLIEQDGITKPEDLIGLIIPMHNGKTIKGEQLMTAMRNHEAKYGSEFVFCKPSEAGEKVKEILRNGG